MEENKVDLTTPKQERLFVPLPNEIYGAVKAEQARSETGWVKFKEGVFENGDKYFIRGKVNEHGFLVVRTEEEDAGGRKKGSEGTTRIVNFSQDEQESSVTFYYEINDEAIPETRRVSWIGYDITKSGKVCCNGAEVSSVLKEAATESVRQQVEQSKSEISSWYESRTTTTQPTTPS